MSRDSVGIPKAFERQSYKAYPLDLSGFIEGPAVILAAQSDDEAIREARACIGDDRIEVWCGTRRVSKALAISMAFRLTQLLDMIMEVEHLQTGHRMSFCLRGDRSDIIYGSFKDNPDATSPLTKECWRGAYLHARRAAIVLGLIETAPASARGGATSSGPRLASQGWDIQPHRV